MRTLPFAPQYVDFENGEYTAEWVWPEARVSMNDSIEGGTFLIRLPADKELIIFEDGTEYPNGIKPIVKGEG